MEGRTRQDLIGGRYRILARAYADAQAITYRAEDARSGEVAALVVLRAPSGAGGTQAADLQQALQRWAGASHSALPAVLGFGLDRGVHYVATEWPGDFWLSRLVQKAGGLSVARAVDVGLQLCSLLLYARQVGLHIPDLTTEDIALDARGNARLLPAALARIPSAPTPRSPSADANRIVAILRTMLGSGLGAAPDLARLLADGRYPDVLALAQALADYWRTRWGALPDRPAVRALWPVQERPPRAPAPPTAARQPRPAQGWDTVGIALAAVALLAILGLIPLWATVYARYAAPVAFAPGPAAQDANTVVVPDLTGLDEATASAVLAQTGLLAQITGQEYSDDVPLGRVLKQDPAGGERAPRGSTVRLVLSKGSDKTTVPDVVGQSYGAAEAALAASNLNAMRQDVWSESPSDTVIAQDPPAGTQVIPGTTVLLRVSSGRSLTINATLGDVARLLTAEADRGSLRPGETLHITFRWQALRPVQNRYSVFVHLVNASGQIVTQDDSEPARGSRPTTTWTAGEVISDAHVLTVPADAAPGEYRVLVGLYLPEANERVPVVQSGRADSEGNALVAHRVTVGP
ncbi:MAG: hypothetical protein Kow00123_17960 [Anaerolineales bacterium]